MANEEQQYIKQEGGQTKELTSSYFGTLKPYGKIYGNNLFTFHRPNIDELVNTLRSFPKPVYWLTSANFLLSKQVSEINNAVTILKLVHDKTNLTNGELNITDLADFLIVNSNQKAMVLISCNEQDEVLFSNKIESIISSLK